MIKKLVEKKNLNNKQKLSNIIFARAICSLGIVIYHYFSKSKGTFKLLRKTANSEWGYIFVTSFFCISGTVLYYNYPKIISLKVFYYKRWKSIFPSFYICYFYFFLTTTFNSHKLFYKAHWSTLIYTLLGLDGYLNYRIKTYYLVGEWFIGAIIIIYILYPLLIFLTNKSIYLSTSIIIICNSFIYLTNFFKISKLRNIITCITSFYFGIISIKFENIFFKNKICYLFFFIVFVLLYEIKIKSFVLIYLIQGFSFFIILVQTNAFIKLNNLKIIINEISNLSYSIFLFHHRIILDIQNLNNPEKWYLHLLLLSVTFVLVIICSKIHLLVMNSIMKNCIFKKLDSFFLSSN